MMNRSFIFGFLLCLLSIPGFAATMPSVRMKVVDAEEGTPIAGAHVLFQANAHEGTFTGHGGRSANLFAVEAVRIIQVKFTFRNRNFRLILFS